MNTQEERNRRAKREPAAHDAFLSYSTVGSAQLGAAVEYLLETMGRAWDQPRALDIFRDVSDQPATSDLAAALLAHLDGSRYFVLLASPEAARSPWVGDEVRRWLARNGVERLLLVLADGDVVWDRSGRCFDRRRSTAIPPELISAYPAVPKWVDLRWTREGSFDPQGERFLDAVADLSATIMGVPKEQLVGIHWREHRKGLARRLAQHAGPTADSATDRALLLAAAANELDDCPETRDALSQAIEASSSLAAVLGTGGEVTVIGNGRQPAHLLAGRFDGAVELWDCASSTRLTRWHPRRAARVTAVAAATEADVVAVGYEDGMTVMASPGDPDIAGFSSGAAVEHLALDPQGRRCAVASADHQVRLWTAGAAQPLRVDTEFTGVAKLVFRDAGTAAVYDWGSLFFVSVEDGRVVEVGGLPFLPRPGPTLDMEAGVRLRFLDEHHVVVQGVDGVVSSWDLRSGQRAGSVVEPVENDPRTVDVDWERQMVLVWEGDRQVDSFGWSGLLRVRATLGGGGRLLAVNLSDGRLLLRDVDAAVTRWSIPAPEAEALAFSPRADVLAWVTESGRVLLLDVATGQATARLRAHPGVAYQLRFSPEGSILAVASAGGRLTLVDADPLSWRMIAQNRAGRRLTSEELAQFGIDRIRRPP